MNKTTLIPLLIAATLAMAANARTRKTGTTDYGTDSPMTHQDSIVAENVARTIQAEQYYGEKLRPVLGADGRIEYFICPCGCNLFYGCTGQGTPIDSIAAHHVLK